MSNVTPIAVLEKTIQAWIGCGYARVEAAHSLGVPVTTFTSRLERAKLLGLIKTTDMVGGHSSKGIKADVADRLNIGLQNAVVLIGSDCHYWPERPSPAHRAFIKLIKDLGPSLIIMNGDVLDGATISRFPPNGWEDRPSLTDEIETCKDRLTEIKEAAPKARRVWLWGNHDGRFAKRLAMSAPEFNGVEGMRLEDHFPDWEFAWSAWLNKNVVVKHRFKGGLHATHNNTLWAGKTIVTGHLHALKITPLSDYNGCRFGVDTGTLAHIQQETKAIPHQFLYTEDSPTNWRSGFAVLTFHKGELLDPELCRVRDEKSAIFRGKIFYV